MKTIVMKFGGKAVERVDLFPEIAEIILKKREEFSKIVVVVSAMGKKTDELIAMAKSLCQEPPKREYDMLVSVGERISIALLAIALHAKGIDAVSFTGSQSGIITTDDHTDARIVDVQPKRLLSSLQEGKTVIVAGFQGMSRKKEITTLGRGGSDTTAVALGIALDADRIEFYKDVPGIYAEHPSAAKSMLPIKEIGYDKALAIVEKTGGQVLAKRALLLAKNNRMPLLVRSFKKEFLHHEGTQISEASLKEGLPIYEENAGASENCKPVYA